MNERIFNETKSEDIFGMNKYQPKAYEQEPFKVKSEVVNKLNR